MLDLSKLHAGAIAAKVEAALVSEIFAQLHQTYLDMADANMKVAITSQPGCGTRFVLHCRTAINSPVGAPEHIEHFSLITSPSARFLKGRRILVVDNEAAIVHAITDLRSSCGAQVDTAQDAAKARARLAAKPGYDLALLDYRLGGG